MATITRKEFSHILNKPRNQCDGIDLYLRELWDGNNAKSIFRITGLDFFECFAGRRVTSGMEINVPVSSFKNE